MKVEYPHAQVRIVPKLGVCTPLIVPSFSSRGFPHLSDIWEEFRYKLYGVCLVSTFDIAGKRIPMDAANMVNVVILDSGLYESKNDSTKSAGSNPYPSVVDWTRELYHETVKGVDESSNVILVNFDQHGALDSQMERASRDFSFAPHAISDFLVKPTSTTDWVNIPKLSHYLEVLKQFDLIGIAAREVGGSLLQRSRSVIMLRDLLNNAGVDTPIHVFGTINPYEVLTYFFCGADIFDGLNWLRLAFRSNGSAPIDESALEDMKWGLPDPDLLIGECTNNLQFLYRLQEVLQVYVTNGSFKSLVEEFPIAIRAAHVAEIAGAEIRK